MWMGSGLYYLVADQLGSTAVVANSSGSKTAEVRYSSGSLPTHHQYTGQYSYVADFG